MAGNSRRKGAMRKPGTKKGAVVGSGGQRRRGLEGKGPTPKAEDREGHPAARQARRAAQPGGARGRESTGREGTGRAGQGRPGRGERDVPEVVAGRNPVVEALRAQVPAIALYLQQEVEADDRIRTAVALAAARGLPLLEVTRSQLDRLVGGALHQGLALTVPAYSYVLPEDLLDRAAGSGAEPLLVVLDGVTDPRNLGATVRSAAAFGAHGVVVPQRRAAGVTVSAWKTSAGAVARVPVARAVNLTRALVSLQQAGLLVIGLAADGDLALDEVPADLLQGPLAVVIGSEGSGLSRLVGEACDLRVRIPMSAATESLNAGVAAGIALYAVAAARR